MLLGKTVNAPDLTVLACRAQGGALMTFEDELQVRPLPLLNNINST